MNEKCIQVWNEFILFFSSSFSILSFFFFYALPLLFLSCPSGQSFDIHFQEMRWTSRRAFQRILPRKVGSFNLSYRGKSDVYLFISPPKRHWFDLLSAWSCVCVSDLPGDLSAKRRLSSKTTTSANSKWFMRQLHRCITGAMAYYRCWNVHWYISSAFLACGFKWRNVTGSIITCAHPFRAKSLSQHLDRSFLNAALQQSRKQYSGWNQCWYTQCQHGQPFCSNAFNFESIGNCLLTNTIDVRSYAIIDVILYIVTGANNSMYNFQVILLCNLMHIISRLLTVFKFLSKLFSVSNFQCGKLHRFSSFFF